LGYLILAISEISYAGTHAEVTFSLKQKGQEDVVSVATVNLADQSTIPLLFSRGRKPWLCRVTATWAEGQLRDTVFVTVADSAILVAAEKGQKPLTVFSGGFSGQWSKGGETIIFEAGGTILHMKVKPIDKKR